MPFVAFDNEAALFEATPVENLFIIDYMYDAPGTALKVYLYARMMALHPELGNGLGDVASALQITEDQVFDAMDYWERRRLMRRVSDNPPTYVFASARTQSVIPSPVEQQLYANRDFQHRLQQLFNDNILGNHELRKAADWQTVLGFDREAVLRIAEYGVATSRSKSPKPASVFRRMDDLAEKWAREGCRTREDVERAIAGESEVLGIARDVLKQFGLSRQPSVPELDSVRRWIGEWGFDREHIMQACAETTNSRNPSFKYLDGILQRRREGDDGIYSDLTEVLRELRPNAAQPSPEDMVFYRRLLDAGFSKELIRLAAIQCHRQNRFKPEDLEWRLTVWQNDGVHTPEAAEAYTKQQAAYAKQLRKLFNIAGADRKPSFGEIQTYAAWQDKYPAELIDFAAECASGAGGSVAYMDKLLEVWARDGVTTVETARAQHEAWKQSHAGAADGTKPVNPALDYSQREYRDEDFGEDFFLDPAKFLASREEKA